VRVLQCGKDADFLVEALRGLLDDTQSDPAMIAKMLMLPGEAYLADLADMADPSAIHETREALRRRIARELRAELLACHERNRLSGPYEPSAGQIALRSLKNICLAYLVLPEAAGCELAVRQYRAQHNMSDVLAALTAVAHYDASPGRTVARELLADFHARWRHEALVLNLWFQTQALRPGADTLADVITLRSHADFDMRNPNKVRALIGAFSASNPSAFHRRDGAGYHFLREQIETLDSSNPMIAARLVAPLTRWKQFAPAYREGMRATLDELARLPNLSRDCFELVSKSLT
jgi:aminopeptidase N